MALPTTEERKRERLGDTMPQEAKEAAILTNALLTCSESAQWKSFLILCFLDAGLGW